VPNDDQRKGGLVEGHYATRSGRGLAVNRESAGRYADSVELSGKKGDFISKVTVTRPRSVHGRAATHDQMDAGRWRRQAGRGRRSRQKRRFRFAHGCGQRVDYLWHSQAGWKVHLRGYEQRRKGLHVLLRRYRRQPARVRRLPTGQESGGQRGGGEGFLASVLCPGAERSPHRERRSRAIHLQASREAAARRGLVQTRKGAGIWRLR